MLLCFIFFAYKIGSSNVTGSSKISKAAQKNANNQSGIFAY